MDRTVRNAAKALIIKDDKMLAIKISDGKEEWYIMPGGGQDVEELLPEAVCREVAEEMGLRVVVKDLAFVIEGLHGEKFHRVDLVFLCEYIGKLENAVLQSDTNQVGYDWLDIKTLNTKNLQNTVKKGGCGECQTSCQSACKTSCTVGNQSCENK